MANTYKVNYDAVTGEIKGIYGSDIVYQQPIPEPYIELSETDWKILINSQTQKVVNVTMKKLEDYVPTDYEKLVAAQTAKIAPIQVLLTQTDYEALKFAEGQLSSDVYANMKTARENWRAAIREIKACTTVDAVNAVTYSTTVPTV